MSAQNSFQGPEDINDDKDDSRVRVVNNYINKSIQLEPIEPQQQQKQVYNYYFGDSDEDGTDEDPQQDFEMKQQQQQQQQQNQMQLSLQQQLMKKMKRRTTQELEHEANKTNNAYNMSGYATNEKGNPINGKKTQQNTKVFRNCIKLLVSKKKIRWESNEFSLDLTYITPQVIAMGFPSIGMESFYRNDRQDVKKFFDQRHPKQNKIYNLCSEREYKADQFDKVGHYPFQDHQAPKFTLIYKFCKDMFTFLHEEGTGENIAGVHCKAGKGRTGVMICCYLIFAGIFDYAIDALRYYGMMRTKNKKGVTIPSQIRYVQYFEKALHLKWKQDNFPDMSIKIMKIKLLTIPNCCLFGGCTPFFTITYTDNDKQKVSYCSSDYFNLQKYEMEPYIEFVLSEYLVKGDVYIQFFNQSSVLSKKEKMFEFWFNCAFFENNEVMLLDKNMLDTACKDRLHKKFSESFHVEIHAIKPIQDERIEIMEKSYLDLNKEKIEYQEKFRKARNKNGNQAN